MIHGLWFRNRDPCLQRPAASNRVMTANPVSDRVRVMVSASLSSAAVPVLNHSLIHVMCVCVRVCGWTVETHAWGEMAYFTVWRSRQTIKSLN